MAQESRLVIVIDSKNAERNARNLSNELDSIERKGDFATKSMDGLSVATRQLAGYMAGLVTVGAAISKMDAYTGLQNRLKLVTNSQDQLNKATEDTFRIAQKTYSAWDSVLQVYQRFSDNAKTLNLTMDDTARLTETVSKAVAISGASAQAADAALVQFGQALASGTLRGEELNSVMEQTPALAKAIAQGMGITIGELRSVAAEGKITSQEIVKALRNVESNVDEVFGRTEITVGQSLTLLNNEITKFAGEAGKGTGAAQLLSGSIRGLASNLELITDGAIVVGIGLITQAILMKGKVVKDGVVSTLASRQATLSNAQAEYAESTATLNAAKAHLANVQATNAEAQAKFGATAANARYVVAQDAVTAATNAQTVAQGRLNAASLSFGRLASGAFALIGGPVGAITLGVAGLAAGYMYLQQRADDANKKLEEQGKIADRTRSELEKLNGVERKSAVNDLTTAFDAQNKALEKSRLAVGSALIDIQNYEKGNWKVVEVINQANKGTISYSDAITQLNDMKISPDLYNALKKQVEQYDANYEKANKSATALKIFGVEVVVAGNKAQNAAIQHNLQSEALEGTALAANKATKALQDFQNKQKESAFESLYKQGYLEKGFTIEQTNAIYELQKAKGESAILSKQEIDSVLRNVNLTQQLKDKQDAILESKRASLRESKKQTSEYQKQQKEADRIKEQQAQSRATISYDFADDFERIGIEYRRQVKDISDANFKEEHDKYMQFAKQRYDFETWMYLRQLTEENDSFRWSEEYKLKFFYETQREMVSQSGRFNDEMKELRLQKLNEQEQQELALVKLAQEQRLFQSKLFLMSETEAMRERYRLEREEIERTAMDAEERSKRLSLLQAQQQLEQITKSAQAVKNWQSTYAEMTGNSQMFQLDQTRQDRTGQSLALVDAQNALAKTAEERESIWQAHMDRMALIESEYQASSFKLNLSYGEQITGSMSEMFKVMFGEQSRAYTAMFALEKGFAVAQAAVSLANNISKASEIGFPYNLPMIAGAIGQGAQILSILGSANFTPQGFATGGQIRGPGTTTSDSIPIMASDKEFMFKASSAASIGLENLNYMNKTGELPPNHDAAQLSAIQRQQRQSDLINTSINQRNAGSTQSAAPTVVDNQMVVNNFIDPKEIPQAMATPYGTKVFMNFIKLNKSTIRGMLGVPS
ncbi:MAG TPA: hypothetical protein EYH52_16555 [Acinetobacter venetianus]|uniref:tape measure protein n=1 Tax=Acinetobacter venetianus TaxID=52133 RepID=UPI001A150E71|nr:tape measure protein [Acinetobacter venetianus]HIQ36206.1 hypothetical protein [Acinetobacter venetianus]